ncbi:MAG TPA: MoaD/ThiS family protein [Thermoleophilia bacterium]|nr:MoaD/ThiS family protein [Thermoleophilia bacterium]
MLVIVKTLLYLAEALGGRELELHVAEGTRLDQLLTEVAARAGPGVSTIVDADGSLHAHIRVSVNGRPLNLLEYGADTVLSEGDEVLLMPPAGGG